METKKYTVELTDAEMLKVYYCMKSAASNKRSALNYLYNSRDEDNPNQKDWDIADWLDQLAEKFHTPSYNYLYHYSTETLYEQHMGL